MAIKKRMWRAAVVGRRNCKQRFVECIGCVGTHEKVKRVCDSGSTRIVLVLGPSFFSPNSAREPCVFFLKLRHLQARKVNAPYARVFLQCISVVLINPIEENGTNIIQFIHVYPISYLAAVNTFSPNLQMRTRMVLQ